jgi:hypothetical protein
MGSRGDTWSGKLHKDIRTLWECFPYICILISCYIKPDLRSFHLEVGFDCTVLHHERNEILSSFCKTLRFIRKRAETKNLERRNLGGGGVEGNISDDSTRRTEAEYKILTVCLNGQSTPCKEFSSLWCKALSSHHCSVTVYHSCNCEAI